mgnify:FL=1
MSPVCMGRKAAKVAAKKQKGEAKRTKLYGKYGKLIVAAVKEGGGADPVSNTQLARVLADAARLSVPRELVDRNIKRATDGSQADYMELTYEAYGEGGVGIVIEVLSDNVNRAAADTKATINKNGGKVAEPGSGAFYTLVPIRPRSRGARRSLRTFPGASLRPGSLAFNPRPRCLSTPTDAFQLHPDVACMERPSVLFNFERKGVITIDCALDEEENVFEVACENGGDDVVPREDGEDGFTIYTEVQGFMQCQRALGDAGFEINPDETALKMIPLASVEVSDEAAEVNEALVEKLLELEDVDAVYTQ